MYISIKENSVVTAECHDIFQKYVMEIPKIIVSIPPVKTAKNGCVPPVKTKIKNSIVTNSNKLANNINLCLWTFPFDNPSSKT